MNYSMTDTILIYSVDTDILRLAEKFSESNFLKLHIADRETDLIAVPNLLIITDINKLTNETFDYIRGFVDEGLFEDETIISYTEPKTELAIYHSKYFEIELDLSIQYLEGILPRRIRLRAKSDINEK